MTLEGLSERRLQVQDCAVCVPLSAEPQWNQIAADWRLMLEAGDSFGLFTTEGRLVASGLTVPFDGPFGWISMILVTQAFRRRGLATHLMRRCMDALLTKGLTPALDATPEGRQVYLHLGFKDVYTLTRFFAEKPQPTASPARREHSPDAKGRTYHGGVLRQNALRRGTGSHPRRPAAARSGLRFPGREGRPAAWIRRRPRRPYMQADRSGRR